MWSGVLHDALSGALVTIRDTGAERPARGGEPAGEFAATRITTTVFCLTL